MKQVGLMDCNNFFVSCERLFRPDLLNKPVSVLSSNDGCIVARSQEVKDMGIPMGMPYFQIKDVCEKEEIVLFSSNFALYRDISARVMKALKEEVDIVEIYSVDEAFFGVDSDVSESEMLEVRSRIMQKTGIPVSIGVAPTKTLAKYESTEAKKSTGVSMFDIDRWNETAKTLPCGSIWGIGRQTSASLSEKGVSTIAEFLALDPAYVKKEYGVVGERLALELHGTPVYFVNNEAEHLPETHTSTRSFGKATTEQHVLESAISHHVAHIAKKLREHGQVASRLSVLARGSRFGDFSHRKSSITHDLEYPTNDTLRLTKASLKLFGEFYDPQIPYKKAGAVVSGLLPEKYLSGSLFEAMEEEASLNEVIDALTDRFGRNAIQTGSSARSAVWREKRQKISQQYTTHWAEIPHVKAI